MASEIRPIRQCMSNGSVAGTYNLQILERPKISIGDFKTHCDTKHTPPPEVAALMEGLQCHPHPAVGLAVGRPEEAEVDAVAMAPVERLFWRRCGHTAEPPEYGGDQPNLSVFGKAAGLAGSWDMNMLPTLLRAGLTGADGGQEVPGVTTPMLYIGMWRALFGWHTEDMEFNSINYLHAGAPKLWYCIPPAYANRFEVCAPAATRALAPACRRAAYC
jgi:jumonji domain-containing protein 2